MVAAASPMEGRWILMVPSMLLLPEQRHCIPSEETEDFLSHTSADGCVPGNHGAAPGLCCGHLPRARNPSRRSPLSQPERASARCFPRQLPPAKQLPPDPQSFAVFFALPIKGGKPSKLQQGPRPGLASKLWNGNAKEKTGIRSRHSQTLHERQDEQEKMGAGSGTQDDGAPGLRAALVLS